MSIIYDKTNWIDRETPVDAQRLNKVEDAIEYLLSISHDIPKSEMSRIQSEQTRRSDEELRQSNEVARNNTFNDKIKEVDSAKNNLISSVTSAMNDKISQVDRVKDSLTTTVNNKMSEVEGFVAIKNAQIDDKKQEMDTRFSQLTSQQQQDSEVIDARTGVTGKTYTSIKDRIDSIELSPSVLFETVEG